MILKRKDGFILIGVYLLFYTVFLNLLPEEYLSMGRNITIFLGSGLATVILYNSYKKSLKMKKYIYFLFLTSLLCFIGNLMYFYSEAITGEVPTVHISTFFYMLNNVTLAVAIYYLMEKSAQKWDGIKIFIDGFILGLMFFYIAWALMFNNVVTYLLFDNYTDGEKFINLFYLFSDFLMIFGLLLFFTFNKIYLKNKTNVVAALGFIIYFLADLSYVYTGIYKSIDESFLDVLWPLALLLLAVSTSVGKNEPLEKKESLYEDRNKVFNILVGILGAVLLILAPPSFLVVLPLIIFRMMISKFIKVSRYNVLLVENSTLDPLTKVFNRRKFSEELEKSIKEEGVAKGGLLLMEINRFKYINSSYGYEIGDKILIDSSKKLKEILQEKDILGRWNGDEFIIFFKENYTAEEISKKSREILESFMIPFRYSEKEIHCSINIGIAFYPENGETASDLVRFADAALNSSKAIGKNEIVLYDKNSHMTEEYEEI